MAFELSEIVEYGFRQYGLWQRFEVGLDREDSLDDQPFGLIGAGTDLTGRMNTRVGRHRRQFSAQGRIIGLTTDCPCLTVAALGFCGEGEDLYQRTLFLVNSEYGLLAVTNVVAGRSAEDCCSPEVYNLLHKIRLGRECPLRLVQPCDLVAEAVLADWRISTNTNLFETQVAQRVADCERLQAVLDEAYLSVVGDQNHCAAR